MTEAPPDFATNTRLSLFNGANAAAGLEATLRRSLIAAARDYSALQEQIDCAELALALGRDEAARLIYELVFIRLGFAPERLERQRELARRTGLWDAAEIPVIEQAETAAFSVEAALAELKALKPITLPDLPDAAPGLAHNPNTHEHPPVPASLVDEITHLCTELYTLLRQAGADERLADLLNRLRSRLGTARAVAEDVGGDIDELIARFVYGNLRDFLLQHHDIAFAPHGSPALFHVAARLDPAALGPWFGNVGNIIRSSRDVFGLIQLALGDEVATFERWTVLLAVQLPQEPKLELIDELADIGLIRPIWRLLESAEQRMGSHDKRPILWRIRDAGLDCGDAELAITAQRLIAEQARGNRTEWTILGEIHATFGDDKNAEAMFARALAIDPKDSGALARLTALRQGRFEKYALAGGFGSSLSRQQLRRSRATETSKAA